MNRFIFKSYLFDQASKTAIFNYAFENGQSFTEKVTFELNNHYNHKALDRALFLSFIIVGISYYKAFPSTEVLLDFPIDKWQANFFNKVYQEGLGQFAYENGLDRSNLAHFTANTDKGSQASVDYEGRGIIALQSGGKDSLLTATLLNNKGKDFTAWYLSSGETYPSLLDSIGTELIVSNRHIDRTNLKKCLDFGALNGHVPVTYIVQSYAVIQAVLLGKSDILVSIAHEGEEPHHVIGDLSVTHQWSKTWLAEELFSEYVSKYITPDLRIGSPLRCFSELRVAELFVENSWDLYGYKFSSCNTFNYQQGQDNKVLGWCGVCPKCVNSYLLFAPFLSSSQLKKIFNGVDLSVNYDLTDTFKGLLAVDGFSKPFECIGEVDELRRAYGMAVDENNCQELPFQVPKSSFDYKQLYPAQNWAVKVLQ